MGADNFQGQVSRRLSSGASRDGKSDGERGHKPSRTLRLKCIDNDLKAGLLTVGRHYTGEAPHLDGTVGVQCDDNRKRRLALSRFEVLSDLQPVAYGAGAAHIGRAALATIRDSFVVETPDALFELCWGMLAAAAEAYRADRTESPMPAGHVATLPDTITFYDRMTNRCREVASRLHMAATDEADWRTPIPFNLTDHAEFMALTEATQARDARDGHRAAV